MATTGKCWQVEQVVYKHLRWPDASSRIFSSLLAHIQGKKELFPLNWNPSVIKYSASVLRYIASPKQSFLHSHTNTYCESSRNCVNLLCVTTILPYWVCLFIEKCFSSVTNRRESCDDREILFSPGAAWCRFDGAPRRGSAPKTSHKHAVNTVTLNICYFQRSHATVVGTATSLNGHSALCHTFNPHPQNPQRISF